MQLYPESRTAPWEHQKKAWSFGQSKDSVYLNMDMGTGKTKSAIDFANGWDCNLIIIISPKSVREVWHDQFIIHSFVNYEILIPDKGTAAKKAEDIKNKIASTQKLCVVLNYETFWRSPLGPTYKKNRMIKPGILTGIPWDLMILDEAHRIMSPGGRASWGAMRLSKVVKKKLFLSGTAMPSGPQNIYGQYRSLDSSIFGTSFVKFRSRYCIMGGFENRQIMGYQNQEELTAKFYSKAFRVTKEEVLDLPPTMHEHRKCELSKKAQKIYNEFADEMIVAVKDKELSAQNALVKLLRLQQMAGGYIQLDDGTRQELDPDSNPKMDILKDIVNDLPPNEPMVIFGVFTPELQLIKKTLIDAGRNPAELSGKMNQLKEWQNGNFQDLVVQIKTGKEGVDFTRSCYAVYYSKNFSLGDYQQSLARLDRPGQTRPVTYYHIICRKTVDVKLHQALRSKKKIIDYILEYIEDDIDF